MIETENIFLDANDKLALWIQSRPDTISLASVANNVINQNISLISTTPAAAQYLWTCLEKEKTTILARFYFEQHEDIDQSISILSKDIVNVCKHGASGVQLFISIKDFWFVVKNFTILFNDLFFEHELGIGLDILEIPNNKWNDVFCKLRDLHVKSLTLTLKEDTGNKSDFVGRIYGMLHNWDFDGNLYFELLNNYERVDEVIRLVECEKPDLLGKIKFFIRY
ncbi:MAG: hypothetical protein MJ156_00790 [Alphaproteobacteria bacterium]|nr:hypothetical protein [Alphaproteobacteria bacterium]